MTTTTKQTAATTSSAQHGLFHRALRWVNGAPQTSQQKRDYTLIPQTSQNRLDASLNDKPVDTDKLTESDVSSAQEKGKTVLYLAYGSNLCRETFRGMRGIKPISQVNVLVPSLRLTFDLAGIPYKEPCFANSARRDPRVSPVASNYHKNRWHKGMVGVVYEVTMRDYAHIIATEGGGSSYQDILIDCYVLPDAPTVPTIPTSPPFKAHTLFAPAVDDNNMRRSDRITRPDPSYAQPSARYIKLITDGAAECNLPAEYQDYLLDIRPFTITNRLQSVGAAIFSAIWFPIVIAFFGLSRKMQDKYGRSPNWVAKTGSLIFSAMWMSYDWVFKTVFGDGERTMKREADESIKAKRERVYTEDELETEELLEEAVDVMNRGHAKENNRDDRHV